LGYSRSDGPPCGKTHSPSSNHRLIADNAIDNLWTVVMWEQLMAGRIWRGEWQDRAKDGTLY